MKTLLTKFLSNINRDVQFK